MNGQIRGRWRSYNPLPFCGLQCPYAFSTAMSARKWMSRLAGALLAIWRMKRRLTPGAQAVEHASSAVARHPLNAAALGRDADRGGGASLGLCRHYLNHAGANPSSGRGGEFS